jgi:hypothetical protein
MLMIEPGAEQVAFARRHMLLWSHRSPSDATTESRLASIAKMKLQASGQRFRGA